MNKEQAVKYLSFSGFSDEQIKAIEGAFTCEDAISRQAVLELYEGWWLGHTKEDDFVTEVRALPSVTPQPIECEERKSGNCPFYAN